MKNIYLPIIGLFFVLNLNAQNPIYRVYLKDKGSSTEMLKTPEKFLSAAAINRRALQNIPISESDLPIAEEYKETLKVLGAKTIAQSKWLNYLYLSHPNPSLIQSLPFVKRIEFPKNHQSQISTSGAGDSLQYGYARGQVEMLSGHFLHLEGYTGTGINIAVIDAGFTGVDQSNAFDSLNNSQRLLGTYNFITGDTNVYTGWGDHGTRVLSTMAANIPDTIIGTAPHANYWLFTTENIMSEKPIEMDHWVMAAEFADSVGVHVINTSLSYRTFDDPQFNYVYSDMDGNTTVITKAADLAASKGILVVASAGNDGNMLQPSIAAPADGDSVLTVGALTWQGDYATFSSRGPSFDGRVKPDVMAQGSPVTLVDGFGQLNIDFGTSYASPIIAGLAACLIEAYPAKHGEEIANYIRQSSHRYLTPGDSLGYGIPNFQIALSLSTPEFLIQEIGFALYPNPVKDFIIIDSKEKKNWKTQITISDLQGKIVLKKELFATDAYRLNLNLDPGYYIVALSGDLNGVYKLQVKE